VTVDGGRGSQLSERSRARVEQLPVDANVLALGCIVLASFVGRVVLARLVHNPFVFLDELAYERTALNLVDHGRLGLFAKAGLAYSPLYPVVIAPVYAVTSSAADAWEWVKVLDALLVSLALVPIYAIAHFVLARRAALIVTGLAGLAPLMFYSSLVLSENVAYPLVLIAVWALLKTSARPRPLNDAFLLAAIGIACAARLQLVVLVPIALTTVAVLTLRYGRRVLAQHWLLLAGFAALAVVVIGRAVAAGSVPLAGRYGVVGRAHVGVIHVAEIAVQHLGALDLILGVLPFVAALAGAAALVTGRLSPNGLIFGTAATASVFWLVLETAFDAAAFDRAPSKIRTASLTPDLPRIHERYLIYLVPFFLIALVWASARPKTVPRVAHVAAALVAVGLPAAIPFHSVINHTMVADSPSLQLFGRTVRGDIVPVSHATTVAVFLAAVLSGAYLMSVLGRYEHLAIPLAAVVFLFLSTLTGARFVAAANGSAGVAFSGAKDWVDRAAGNRQAVLLSGKGVGRVALTETAFYNLSIGRVYFTCRMQFGADYGETRVTENGSVLEVAGQPLQADLVVAPTSLDVRGSVLARNPRAHLVLVAPTHGIVDVGARGRAVIQSCPF